MKIGELAKQSGTPASTIRFYEARGLLKNKAHLTALIQLIDSKPADIDCKENANRVMASMNKKARR